MLLCESDNQLAAICDAARQLRFEDRERYLQIIAGELANRDIGDGAVDRAIRAALRTIGRNPAPR
jgi:hypothetical protein